MVPTLRLRLAIDAGDRPLRGITLGVRVNIHAERRRYGEEEAERLREVFGPPEQWGRSLGSLPWTQSTVHVGPFAGATVVEARVPCSYDFEVAASKYLCALEDGEIPLELLFDGTLFWSGADGRLQSAMVPWDREASARLPLSVWSEAMRAAFGDAPWIRLQREVFARLQAERSRRGLTSWEDTIDALLREAGSRVA